MHLISLLLLLATLCEPSHQDGFTRPTYHTALKPGKYAGVMVWKVGDVEQIKFNVPWPEYKIEWWQQSLVTEGARVAEKPVYQRKIPIVAAFTATMYTNFIRVSRSKGPRHASII